MTRILHIASFLGNIGDNFNHLGTRKLIEENLSEVEWFEIEIRETFRNNYSFDHHFAKYCNSFDAVIFGGGNFFELWVDYSVNNTSANLSFDVIDEITVPFYFYALGVDPGMGVTQEGINKFRTWVEYIENKDNFHLSIRNDGALYTLQKYFPEDFENKFTHLVDGGFLVKKNDILDKIVNQQTKLIGINIAGDMLDTRFDGELSYEQFIAKFSAFLSNILKIYKNYNVILIPHIFKDYNVVFDILNTVEDVYRRERIDVAGLCQGSGGMIKTVNIYNKCSIILANRFHSNIIGMILEKKVFGLYNYRQIKELYREINRDNFFDITCEKGLKSLFDSIKTALNEKPSEVKLLNKSYLKENRNKTINFFQNLWV